MTAPELTLENVKKTAQVKTFRASDFLTQEQMDEVKKSNLQGKKRDSFNEIDAYIAEIIARFGYETYLAWKSGEIEETQMVKYIQAERARDVSNRLSLERMIFACVAGANNPTNSGHAPKTLRIATKLLKNEEKLAKGVR